MVACAGKAGEWPGQLTLYARDWDGGRLPRITGRGIPTAGPPHSASYLADRKALIVALACARYRAMSFQLWSMVPQPKKSRSTWNGHSDFELDFRVEHGGFEPPTPCLPEKWQPIRGVLPTSFRSSRVRSRFRTERLLTPAGVWFGGQIGGQKESVRPKRQPSQPCHERAGRQCLFGCGPARRAGSTSPRRGIGKLLNRGIRTQAEGALPHDAARLGSAAGACHTKPLQAVPVVVRDAERRGGHGPLPSGAGAGGACRCRGSCIPPRCSSRR